MKNTILILFLILSQLAYSQINVSISGNDIALNPSLLGLNGRSTEGPSWTNSTFLSMVTEMNPTYVRYPAGTQGNQWNWKTGTFIPGYGNSSYTFSIPMLINGLPVGAKIIYMVNMVLPTAQTGITYSSTTDAVLSTDATLAAKITDILNAFGEFEKNGHLPDVAELGNELYFSNTEAGVYAANPTLYMAHAKQIAIAINNKYPGVKIILCTTKGGTNSRDNWNNTIFNILNSDTAFKSLISGVVQHHYINATYGYTGTVNDATTAETIMNEGIQYVQESISDYNLIPSYLKLWITEFGSTKPNADGMWAAGLRTANMTLSFMQLGTKTDNLIWHHITDDPNVLNTTYLKLGPSGLVFSLLNQAMTDKKAYTRLSFSNMSPLNTYAPLYGFKFSNDTEESLLVVNWGGATYSGLDLSNLCSGKAISYARQYWTATPYVSPVYSGNNINTIKTATITSYTIKPYSITAIRIPKSTSDISGNVTDETISVKYSAKTKNIHVQSLVSNLEEIKLSDISGRIILDKIVNGNHTDISVAGIKPGVYIISSCNNNSHFSQKILIH